MRKKYLIGVCGYFDTVNTIANGQTLRTLAVTRQLQLEIGESNISTVDYSGWRRRPFAVLGKFCKLIVFSKSIIIFPDGNAIRFIAPLAFVLGRIFKTQIYYVVIGGWLPNFLNKHFIAKKILRNFDGLFVQTKVLYEALLSHKIRAVHVFPNFRILSDRKFSVPNQSDEPLKMFYLSRVEEPKGIGEMIAVVKKINHLSLRCTLDIYGPIQPGYHRIFDKISREFPEYIQYCGVLASEKINHTICQYDLQLFPTKYRTEGFPGSILDSFYAGVPVLAAEWDSGREIIADGKDGILFKFGDYGDMFDKLNKILGDRQLLNALKLGSRAKGDQFSAHNVIALLLKVVMQGS